MKNKVLVVLSILLMAATSFAGTLSITNPGFETDTAPVVGATGWTITSGGTDWFTTTAGAPDSAVDPDVAAEGDNWLSGNRLATGAGSSNNPQKIIQLIDISADATQIDTGTASVTLDFMFADNDQNDDATVNISFFSDVAGTTPIGGSLTTGIITETGGGYNLPAPWAARSLSGAVPAGARSLEIEIYNNRTSGSAGNVHFDDLSGSIAESVPVSPVDLVTGNMMLMNENAGWCWYQDEKIIYDPVDNAVITSTTNDNSGFEGPVREADIDATTFNIDTGSRTRVTMANIYSYGSGDDHNMGALWRRPDGRYLHMYGGHNANDYSYYRTTVNPNDGTSWSAQSSFNWETLSGLSDSGNLTYHNLHYLSAEGTGNGRLYNISRQFDRSPYLVYSDDWGENWTYAGKLSSPDTGSSYSNGYYKYTSNGVDRIDFIATEHHPRDYNNSIYHGYIQGGKSYNSSGTEIDDNIFNETAPGPEDFTPVFTAGSVAAGQYHTAWTIELELDENDYPVCLFITRFGTDSYGGEAGAADHRLFYGRFNGSSWTITELCKMGPGIQTSEQDYTGLGCIHPDNSNLVYISTPFDPSDDTPLDNHEIFKGVTADNGATWQWTQITFDSTVDNLRPAVPSWDANNTALFWLRGYSAVGGGNPAQNFDQVLVGMIDRHNETISLATYIDADPSNTTEADSSPFTPTGPSGSSGAADDQWHEYTEYGNAGSCYTADELSEDAPMLKTTISGLSDGTYDVFAYFWCDPSRDWGVAGGFTPSNILYFNRQSSQHAEASEFFGSVRVVDFGAILYRVYIGRREVVGGAPIDVYIDDYDSSLINGADRAVYDGVGAASVIPDYAGDLYRDGKVNYMDIAVLGQGWQTIYDIDTLTDIAENWLAGL